MRVLDLLKRTDMEPYERVLAALELLSDYYYIHGDATTKRESAKALIHYINSLAGKDVC